MGPLQSSDRMLSAEGKAIAFIQQHVRARHPTPEQGQFLGHPVHPRDANGTKQAQEKIPVMLC